MAIIVDHCVPASKVIISSLSFDCFLMYTALWIMFSPTVTVSVRFEEVVYSLPESQGSVQVCAEIVSPAVAERVYFLLLSSVDRDAGVTSVTRHSAIETHTVTA